MKSTQRAIARAAQTEITEHHIYRRIAAKARDAHTRKTLERIAGEEHSHYERWRKLLEHDVAPVAFKVWVYPFLARVLGLLFALRLMERGERVAVAAYRELSATHPDAIAVLHDEQRHEAELLGLIDERRLRYVSSVVLGLNDALVELTGALAGLTLALANTRLIAVVGLITGIAASFAMAASEYLSTKEERGRNPLQAGLTTGVTYFVTVVFLITPFILLDSAPVAFAFTLSVVIAAIAAFTFYTAVANNRSFRKKFSEMTVISLGAAALNFVIGYAIKISFGL